MAFEDRSSPNTATSPNSEMTHHHHHHHHHQNAPNSPESTRTSPSPFTCTTMISKSGHYISPPSSPLSQHGGHPRSLGYGTQSVKIEQQEKTFFRITSFALSSPKREDDTHSEASTSPPPEDVHEPTIQTLKYSITNILQPDFGKSAVLRTKITPKISFKPYESEVKPFDTAPLGSLCHAVSRIGKSSPIKTPQPIPPPTRSPNSSPQPSLPSPEEITKATKSEDVPQLWPAWVYCTRYSDRPSSGPRSRRMKKPSTGPKTTEDKRPRTAFSGPQLARLKHEFAENRYLTERRRQQLSGELGLNEAQIKIWFQNKRAKIKKSNGQKNPLAIQLMAQGLYNHSTVACDEDDMPMPT